MSAVDTIFALASARGRAGVCVIRLSGPDAHFVGEQIAGPIKQPRLACLRSFRDPETSEIIDKGLVLYFEETSSFTGEKVLELQCHGSLSVIDAIMSILGNFDRCRLAEPGEFTKRALVNGKMDLVQVEGLADLIEAETEEQRRQANRLMRGELRKKGDLWRDNLLKINSLIEASIDFADEELPDGLLGLLREDISNQIAVLNDEISGSKGNEIVRSGFTVVILGKPNVGKSTLLNALAGREIAIASEIAGTTRDVIEARLDLGGIPVSLLDTAGLHETSDTIEIVGMDLARRRAADADLKVFLIESFDDLGHLGVERTPDDILVFPKADLQLRDGALNISAKTGIGVDDLVARIQEILFGRLSSTSSLVRDRHVHAASQARRALLAARQLMAVDGYDIELVAERVREALGHLDHLVGRFDVEAVLGEIFSSFCIGK